MKIKQALGIILLSFLLIIRIRILYLVLQSIEMEWNGNFFSLSIFDKYAQIKEEKSIDYLDH